MKTDQLILSEREVKDLFKTVSHRVAKGIII